MQSLSAFRLLGLPAALRRFRILIGEVDGWLSTGNIDQVSDGHAVLVRKAAKLLQRRVSLPGLELPQVPILTPTLGCRCEREPASVPGHLQVFGDEPKKSAGIHASSGTGSVLGCDHPTVYLFNLDEHRGPRFHCRLGDRP